MTLGALLDQFFSDGKVGAALLVVALDFLLGVIAALKKGTFRGSYVADFARNDIAFKLAPYLLLYAGAIVAGDQHFLIEGLDIGLAAGGFYTLIMAAWVFSIGNSLIELREPSGRQTVAVLLGDENAAPPKD